MSTPAAVIPSSVWITWERQRRSVTMAARLGAELIELLPSGGRLRRYAAGVHQTIAVLRRKRPRVLFVQNPSIVLAFLACTLGRLYAGCVVVDAHNAGLYPLEGRSRVLQAVARWIARRADLVIVSNEALAGVVRGWGARAFVLPDPLPAVPARRPGAVERPSDVTVVYVCTWALDEPYDEVIAAAAAMVRCGRNVRVRITGRPPRHVQARALPPNVELLGFVPEASYWDELDRSAAVMVLTRRQDCLTCGAYEAVALGQAMILSNTAAIRGHFRAGAIYVEPTAEGIAAALETVGERAKTLRTEASSLAAELEAAWRESATHLAREVSRLCDRVTTADG